MAPLASAVSDHRVEPALQWPVKVIWYLTDQCNLACDYCLNNSSPSTDVHLDTKDALRIVDTLVSGGVSRAALLGGEPTLHPGFFDIVHRLSDRKVAIDLVTNGVLLDDVGFLLELETLGRSLASVQLSLHMHDRIAWYAELIDRLGNSGFATITLMVLTMEDLLTVPAAYREIAAAGAGSFFVAPVSQIGRASDGAYEGRIPSIVDFATLILQLRSIQKREGYSTIPTFKHRGLVSNFLNERFDLEIVSHVCEAALSEFQIRADGRCSPCCFIDQSEETLYVTEPIASANSLDDIWNGRAFQRFRHDKLWGERTPILQSCFRCRHHLSGRCRPCALHPSECVSELRKLTSEMRLLETLHGCC